MSPMLTETIESLHIAAARRLLELIQNETDPGLLARLISIASRFKTSRPNASAPPAPPTPLRASAVPPAIPQTPSPNAPPAPSPAASVADVLTTLPPQVAEDDATDEDEEEGPACEIPHPYTDQQFLDLTRQYGYAEADTMRTRRYAIIAHLTRRKDNTRSARQPGPPASTPSTPPIRT